MKITTKTLLFGLGVFLTVVAAVLVVFVINKQAMQEKTSLQPMVTPNPKATEKPAVPQISEVSPSEAACSLSFIVPCASATPTPTPNPSATPTPTPTASPTPNPSATPTSAPTATPTVTPTPAPGAANLSCVTKRVYADDSRNRAGFYYLENQISDANTLSSGDVIVYNIVAKNSGDTAASDVTVTDTLSSSLSYVDADTGCSYNSSTRVVTCNVGTLGAQTETSRSIRVRVSVAGTYSIQNTAEVFSTNGQRSSCSVSVSATGIVVTPTTPAPTSLPNAGVFEVTAGTIGAGVLMLLVGAIGLLLL